MHATNHWMKISTFSLTQFLFFLKSFPWRLKLLLNVIMYNIKKGKRREKQLKIWDTREGVLLTKGSFFKVIHSIQKSNPTPEKWMGKSTVSSHIRSMLTWIQVVSFHTHRPNLYHYSKNLYKLFKQKLGWFPSRTVASI